MAKKKKIIVDPDLVRIFFVILGSAFSVLVIVFSVFAMTKLSVHDISGASDYMLVIFLVLGASRLVTYLRDRSKTNMVRFISLFVVNAALGVLVYFGRYNYYLYTLAGGLFCITIIASCVFKIISNHSIRSIVANAIVIALAILLAVGLFMPSNNPEEPIMLLLVVIIISSFLEVLFSTSSQLRMKVLLKIIIRTYALEILLGLATMMVAFSLILPLYEPDIKTFADGLWFSFTVVTTIGFGDFRAVTAIGRGLTVVLGFYGIIVVAVITSIIVNFYNETAGKKDRDEIKEIKDEEGSKKKKK